MKTILMLALLTFAGTAYAVPVIDKAPNTPTALASALLPDDKDSNLYYFFPSHYQLAIDPNSNKYLFGYVEVGWPRPNGYVTLVFEAATSPLLAAKIQEVKAANPKALFSPIPILDANFEVTKILTPLISSLDCQKKGNEMGQQVECKLSVDYKNRKDFRRVMRGGALIQALDYNYSFAAIIAGKSVIINQTLPANFTNLGPGVYFYDSSGNPIWD